MILQLSSYYMRRHFHRLSRFLNTLASTIKSSSAASSHQRSSSFLGKTIKIPVSSPFIRRELTGIFVCVESSIYLCTCYSILFFFYSLLFPTHILGRTWRCSPLLSHTHRHSYCICICSALWHSDPHQYGYFSPQ